MIARMERSENLRSSARGKSHRKTENPPSCGAENCRKPIALRQRRPARDHCANWREGKCAGTASRPNGSHFRFLPEGSRCLLGEDKRCPYFEEHVVPMRQGEWNSRLRLTTRLLSPSAE